MSKPPGGTPSAAEWAKMNAYLASHNYTPEQRKEAIGQTPNGRSRNDIGNDLISWQNVNTGE